MVMVTCYILFYVKKKLNNKDNKNRQIINK